MADTINLINAAISMQASGTQELRAELSSDGVAGRGFDRFFDVTLIGSCLFTFTAVARARLQRMTVRFRQDATGGRVVVLPANITWAGKITPTLTQIPGDFDEVEFRTFDGGSSWFALLITQAPRLNAYGLCLFKDLASKVVPAVLLAFSSLGFSQPGIGQAMYVDAGQASLPANGKGVWWDTDSIGRQFQLATGEQVTPAKFGALPQSVSTADQSPKINGAINYVQNVVGKGTLDLEAYGYTCANKVKIDSSKCSMFGRGAKLDFGTFVSANPDTQANLLPWGALDTTNGWLLGTLPPRGAEWSIDTTAKTLARPTITSATFSDCGGQIDPTLRTGDQIRLKITINKLSAAGASATYLDVGLFDRGVGIGNAVSGGIFSNNQSITSPTTFTVDIIIPTTKDHADGTKSWDRGAWLTIKTVCNCEIGAVSVSRVPDNRMLSIFTETGSPQYGSLSLPWYGFDIAGPGRFSYAQGIVLESYTTSLSSRIDGQWIMVHDCYIGVNWGTRSYTGGFVFSGFYNCTYPVMSSTGTQDAGENISFVQCGFFNSTVGIYNPGNFEFSFHQCSIDYNGRFYEGGGTIKFSQCHFEMGATKLNADGSQRVPFIVTGNLDITDSYILTTTPLNGTTINNSCMFQTLTAGSSVRLKNVAGYDWMTSSGYLMQGLGTLLQEGLHGGGNLNIPFRLADDDAHRMTGSAGHFEGTTLNLDSWMTGSTTYRARVTTITAQNNAPPGLSAGAIKGNGTFTGVVGTDRCEAGTWTVKFTSATTYNVIRPDYTTAITGGTIGTASGSVALINTAGFMTAITQGSTGFATNDQIKVLVGDQPGKALYTTDFNGTVTGGGQMALTTADASTGTQCLEITRTGTGSLVVYLVSPFRPASRGGMTLNWRYVAADGSTSTSTIYLYCQCFRAKVLYGEGGIPVMTENLFAGEGNPVLVANASTAWDAMTFNMNNSENTNGLSPQYTNALVLKLNLSALPAGARFRVDEFEVFCA